MTERAIVVGAGFAGLCAAAAVAPYVGEVLVVERDILASDARPRRGVPQARQLHNILGRAQLHLEQLFPGFLDALDAAGCGRGRVSTDTWVNELGVRMPERDLGFDVRCAPRPVIDLVARNMLASLPTVSVLDGSRVASVVTSGGCVEGVHVVDSTARAPTPRIVPSTIVIDATGPAALAVRTYQRLGRTVEDEVDHPDQWYTSVEVYRPNANRRQFWMFFPNHSSSAGVLVSPTGTGTWYVSASGRSNDAVPETWPEMLDHIARLGNHPIGEVLSDARPVREPTTYRRVVATWHRFDRLNEPLIGLLAIGDAIATLNPLFGQGMSVAAWQASILARSMANAFASRKGIAEATSTYLRDSAAPVRDAWQLGRVVSEAMVAADGTDLTGALAEEMTRDIELHRRYVRIWHLLDSPDMLDTPEIRRRLVARAAEIEAR